MEKGQVLEFTIEDMSGEGKGIGKADGFAVFVDGFAILKATSLKEGSGFLFINDFSSGGYSTGMYKPPVKEFIPFTTASLKLTFTEESLVSV